MYKLFFFYGFVFYFLIVPLLQYPHLHSLYLNPLNSTHNILPCPSPVPSVTWLLLISANFLAREGTKAEVCFLDGKTLCTNSLLTLSLFLIKWISPTCPPDHDNKNVDIFLVLSTLFSQNIQEFTALRLVHLCQMLLTLFRGLKITGWRRGVKKGMTGEWTKWFMDSYTEGNRQEFA